MSRRSGIHAQQIAELHKKTVVGSPGMTPNPSPSPRACFLRSDGTTVKELADALENSVDLTIPIFQGIGRIDQSPT